MSVVRWIPRMVTGALLAGAPLWFAGPPLAAQQAAVVVQVPAAGEVQELRLTDGSVLVGQVTDAGDPVRFRLTSGTVVEIERGQIARLGLLEGRVVKGEVWGRDPSPNRLFFGPTGRSVGQGKGYLASVEAIFLTAGFGVSDRVGIGVGTMPWGGGNEVPIWLIPTLQLIDQEQFDLSVGALAITAGDYNAGILWGAGTFGSADRALTAGLGWGYMDDDLSDRPAVMLAGEVRVARNMKFISENYLIPGDYQIFSFGPRFFGEQLSADLGVAIYNDDYDSGLFPLVNFVWNW